ncbi:MAG: cofactor assembly of complex C subunit B [Oscillatoriales cyanobacterium]|nr:MAG: cofactor assembly of complex C subunit B [Oscillatoriales cyanobacterium]
MTKSDPNKVLRQLPLVAGGLAGTLLMVNRLLTLQITDSQTRSDVLGVIISALLILTGLLWQQVQARSPDSGFEFPPDLPDAVKLELAWASRLLLTNTATRAIVIVYRGKVLLRRGILGINPQVKPGPILQRVLDKNKPVYLVNLNIYPGKIEFDYLPENTQGVICQPLGSQGVLILGANAPRSYTKQDENWVEGIAEKLENTLSQHLNS